MIGGYPRVNKWQPNGKAQNKLNNRCCPLVLVKAQL